MLRSALMMIVVVVFSASAMPARAQQAGPLTTGPAPAPGSGAVMIPPAGPAIGAGSVTVSADPRTNSVVIVAPPAVLEQINQIIAEIDSNPAASEVIMVYRLRNASALNVEAVANMLLNGGTGASRGTTVLPQRSVSRISGTGLAPPDPAPAARGDEQFQLPTNSRQF